MPDDLRERIAEMRRIMEAAYAPLPYDVGRAGVWTAWTNCATNLAPILADELDRVLGLYRELERAVMGEHCVGSCHAINVAEAKRLREEVAALRQHGNKDCTAMADDALKGATRDE